jgi:hypothetical protein
MNPRDPRVFWPLSTAFTGAFGVVLLVVYGDSLWGAVMLISAAVAAVMTVRTFRA